MSIFTLTLLLQTTLQNFNFSSTTGETTLLSRPLHASLEGKKRTEKESRRGGRRRKGTEGKGCEKWEGRGRDGNGIPHTYLTQVALPDWTRHHHVTVFIASVSQKYLALQWQKYSEHCYV